MIEIKVDGNIDRAILTLMKQVRKDGILSGIKNREQFPNRSLRLKAKRKRAEAKRKRLEKRKEMKGRGRA